MADLINALVLDAHLRSSPLPRRCCDETLSTSSEAVPTKGCHAHDEHEQQRGHREGKRMVRHQ